MRKTETFKLVEGLLEQNQHSAVTGVGPRDSDNELYIQYIHYYTNVQMTPELAAALRSINFESIRRGRQKLQEQGKYLPDSPEVAKRRRLKSYEIQQVAPTESAAGLQRRIEEN